MDYKLIQTIISFIGLIPILLLWWQIKSDLKWKKINSSIDKLDLSLLINNKKFISDFGIDMEKDILSDEDYEKIIDKQNIELLYKVRDILDMLENFSILYNIKLLNKYFAYESYSENIITYYKRFTKIIYFYRNKYDPYYYINLEICAKEFIKKRDEEQKRYEKYEKKIKRKSSIFKVRF